MADIGGWENADIDLNLEDMFRSKCGDAERLRSTLQEMARRPHTFVVPSEDTEKKIQTLEYALSSAISMGIPIEVAHTTKTPAISSDYIEMFVGVRNPKGDLWIQLIVYVTSCNVCVTIHTELMPWDPVEKAVVLGTPEQLRMLLNLGMERRFTQSMLRYYIRHIKDWITVDLKKPISLNNNGDSLRRRSLVMELLYVASYPYSKFSNRSQLKDNLAIIWRQLPDAYITTTDIRNCCVEKDGDSDQEFLFGLICERAREIAPNDLDFPPTPRSLAQYCRCVVRGRLKLNNQLPLGIYSLRGIPKKFQDYLRLN